MKNTIRFGVGVLVLVILGLVGFQVLFELVPPAHIGVKRNLWGGSGIIQEDQPPGFHWGVSGVHQWHLLDGRTHFVTFAESNSGVRTSAARPALDIRTRDNNSASLDVTVTYRIMDGKAHLIVGKGLENTYRDRTVSAIEGVLREELARLTPEEFVNTATRVKRAADALPLLREKLADFFVEPERILIRAARFPVDYEAKLQEKQLTRQRALLAPAKEAVENQLQITGSYEVESQALAKEVRAEWDKRLQTESSENQVTIAGIFAEADVYDRGTRADADATFLTYVAEGDLALERSEAPRAELRNQALDTVGGRIYLASQAAENLRFDHVTLNSNDENVPSVLDVDEMVRLLMGQKPAGQD